MVFGAAFALMSLFIVLLNREALKYADDLSLNAHEVYQTQTEVLIFTVVGITGVVSIIVALALPAELSPAAGYVYWTLGISTPWLSRYRRGRRPPESDSTEPGATAGA